MTIPRSAVFDWLDDFYLNAQAETKSYGEWADDLLSRDEPEFTAEERQALLECVMYSASLVVWRGGAEATTLLLLAEKLRKSVEPKQAPAPSPPAPVARLRPRLTLISDEEDDEEEQAP
jgi:hypothetical protein